MVIHRATRGESMLVIIVGVLATVCIYVHVCIYIYTYTYMKSCMHTHIHIQCVYIHIHLYIYTRIQPWASKCALIGLRVLALPQERLQEIRDLEEEIEKEQRRVRHMDAAPWL